MSLATPREAFHRNPIRALLLSFVLLGTLLLSGCVRYDVGVNLEGPHRGAIVQRINLGEQLASFSQTEAKKWLTSLERRARQLGGKTKHLSNEEILVTIPFSNGDELESRFNQFFNPTEQQSSTNAAEGLDLVRLNAQMKLDQSNLLLWQRNHLKLIVDLRALGVLSTENAVIVSPDSLFDLDFALNTPWGAKSVQKVDHAISGEKRPDKHQLVWTLHPGEVNTIEAVFWMPMPLGWGTIAIAFLALVGFYLKYKHFPWSANQETVVSQEVVPSETV